MPGEGVACMISRCSVLGKKRQQCKDLYRRAHGLTWTGSQLNCCRWTQEEKKSGNSVVGLLPIVHCKGHDDLVVIWANHFIIYLISCLNSPAYYIVHQIGVVALVQLNQSRWGYHRIVTKTRHMVTVSKKCHGDDTPLLSHKTLTPLSSEKTAISANLMM